MHGADGFQGCRHQPSTCFPAICQVSVWSWSLRGSWSGIVSHNPGGMPGERQETLSGWNFPPVPQGEVTSSFIVDNELIETCISGMTAQGDHSIIRDRVWPIYKANLDEIDLVRDQISRPPFTEEPIGLRQQRTRQLYRHLAESLQRFDEEADNCMALWQ